MVGNGKPIFSPPGKIGVQYIQLVQDLGPGDRQGPFPGHHMDHDRDRDIRTPSQNGLIIQ